MDIHRERHSLITTLSYESDRIGPLLIHPCFVCTKLLLFDSAFASDILIDRRNVLLVSQEATECFLILRRDDGTTRPL